MKISAVTGISQYVQDIFPLNDSFPRCQMQVTGTAIAVAEMNTDHAVSEKTYQVLRFFAVGTGMRGINVDSQTGIFIAVVSQPPGVLADEIFHSDPDAMFGGAIGQQGKKFQIPVVILQRVHHTNRDIGFFQHSGKKIEPVQYFRIGFFHLEKGRMALRQGKCRRSGNSAFFKAGGSKALAELGTFEAC